ncbi:MAG: hypothetical protein CVU90_15640 [Firmicutes bacterium HGW-Firmicutes-15]|nr:MAG: hypothetical protein CVU90_15640 [Firmicutes bacterium HGW-Firmicutes-15]
MSVQLLLKFLEVSLAAGVGVLSYIITKRYDNNSSIKKTARIMNYDIIRAVNILADSKEDNSIPRYNLTSLIDWREQFSIICNSLGIEEAWLIFEFYARLEHLGTIRNDIFIHPEPILNDDKQKEVYTLSLNKVETKFFECLQDVLDLGEMKKVINRLEEMGK